MANVARQSLIQRAPNDARNAAKETLQREINGRKRSLCNDDDTPVEKVRRDNEEVSGHKEENGRQANKAVSLSKTNLLTADLAFRFSVQFVHVSFYPLLLIWELQSTKG